MASSAKSVAKYFFIDLAGSVLHFPFWWYTTGFVGLLKWFGHELSFRWRSYNFSIWMRNFFVPMYGQYDWTGRLVSVVMRFFVLIGRLVAYLVEALAYAVLAVLWLAAPLAALMFFLINIWQGAFLSQGSPLAP